MGKYIRKSKTSGELSVMEVLQSTLGVRTRAKTLALQRLQKSTSLPQAETPGNGGCYLQLRNRRLQKPPVFVNEAKRNKDASGDTCARNPNPNPQSFDARVSSRLRVDHGEFRSRSLSSVEGKKIESGMEIGGLGKEEDEAWNKGEKESSNDLFVDGFFGENVLENEGRERTTRESTPCSLIRDPDSIGTPGSTTRPTTSSETNRRQQQRSSSCQHIPTSREMDDFFAAAEEEQRQQFIDKYNFDPVNDKPLPGRYEWEKVSP